jgi:ribosomal-protein-alanine N-acetyltransferase
MRCPFLTGERIYLRLLNETDITEDYVGWLNDSQVVRYLETGRFPSTPETIQKYIERFTESSTDIIFAIVNKENEKHIGNVSLNDINWIHRTANTGLLIGRKEYWGKRYAFEAWNLVLEYAFERLGLRKVTAGVIKGNDASVATLKKLGFKLEGTSRQQYFVEGSYNDAFRFGLLKDEFWKYSDIAVANEKHRTQ